jgi:hypothetical protein
MKNELTGIRDHDGKDIRVEDKVIASRLWFRYNQNIYG